MILRPLTVGESNSFLLGELKHLAQLKEEKPSKIPQVVVHNTQANDSSYILQEAHYTNQSNLHRCRQRVVLPTCRARQDRRTDKQTVKQNTHTTRTSTASQADRQRGIERQLRARHTDRCTDRQIFYKKGGTPVSDEMGEGVPLHMLLPQYVARLSEGHNGFIHLIDCHNLHRPHMGH